MGNELTLRTKATTKYAASRPSNPPTVAKTPDSANELQQDMLLAGAERNGGCRSAGALGHAGQP